MRRLGVDKWVVVAMILTSAATLSLLFPSLDQYQPDLLIGVGCTGIGLLCLATIRGLHRTFPRRTQRGKGKTTKK